MSDQAQNKRWLVLAAAFLGWMFDGMEMGIFPLVARPALQEMQAAAQIVDEQFVQLWMGDSSYRDNLGAHAQLPAGYLIDKSGKIVERYVGRIPAEAWDRIADLL